MSSLEGMVGGTPPHLLRLPVVDPGLGRDISGSNLEDETTQHSSDDRSEDLILLEKSLGNH